MPSGAHLTSPQFNKQPEHPEIDFGDGGVDEWGITDDDGSGRGGSKEDYEDFDFEGDDW
jgi:hypothetical protein